MIDAGIHFKTILDHDSGTVPLYNADSEIATTLGAQMSADRL